MEKSPLVTLLMSLIVSMPQAGFAADRKGIQIVVLEGEGAFNNIRRGLAREIVVEVRDFDERPVGGAEVTFTPPMAGPGVILPNGSRSFTTKTDLGGRATTAGLKPNQTEGRFNIKVTAKKDGQEAAVVVGQSNTIAGGIPPAISEGSSKKKWLILTLIGGGVAGGVFAGLRGGNGSSQTLSTTTSLTVGGVTVGGPR